MNHKLVVKILGAILCIEAVCMLLPLLIALFTHGSDVFSFGITILLCGGLGILLYCIRTDGAKMQPRDGFAIVGLAWLLLSATGALPYLISGAVPTYADAYFEAASGFTTTGASILPVIEGKPLGILFWRAETQWMGGMGILVATLALLPKLGEGSINLMRAESPGPTVTKLTPKVGKTARILYLIYIGLTVVETALLMLAGMSLYDAVTHSFATISTGGFSVRNASVAAYHSELINWIIIAFMFLSGINFSLLYAALRRRFGEVLRNEELRFYTAVAVCSTLLISWNLLAQRGVAFAESFSEAAFQVVSVMTTTGFITADYDQWPTFSKTVLIVIMFAGACAGSTAGGIKASRVVTLLKSLRREMRKIIHPREGNVICSDGQRMEEDTVHSVEIFFFAYILILLLGTLVVSWDDVGFDSAFSATLTCLSNVGPGLNAVGPTKNFAALSDGSKLVLSACMLLGRLEIMPLVVLLFPSIWKRKSA